MVGPGFVRSLGTMGRSGPPSIPKPGEGITPGGRAGGQTRSPHPGSVSVSTCPRSSSSSRLLLPPARQTQAASDAQRPAGSSETSPASPSPPAQAAGACPGSADFGQGGRVSPAALPGPWPGPALTTTLTRGFPAAPQKQPEHPKEGCDPTGNTGYPRGAEEMLGRVGCRG